MNTKGQVTFGSLASFILLVAIAAVAGVVFAILMATLQSDQLSTQSTAVVNESNTTAIQVGTEYSLAESSAATNRLGYSLASANFAAINATAGCGAGGGCEAIAAGNFTVNANGTFVLTFGTTYNDTAMNFTYTYTYTFQDADYNVSRNTLGFYTNLSDQWTLLGTVVGLVLVVSIVLVVFSRRSGSGGGI